MRDKLVCDKIFQVITTLDEIDDMIETQSSELQKVDWELSDWLHYIENNDINIDQSIKIMQRIKELRIIRRTLNKEHAIEDTYKNNSNKMMGNNTRQFLANEIHKTLNQLDNDYKNRVLTDEEIQKVIGEVKKKVGRPRKESKGE